MQMQNDMNNNLSKVPREECSQVAREQCRDVPRQVEKQECFKVTFELQSLILFLCLHLYFFWS